MDKVTRSIKTSHPYIDSNISEVIERGNFRANAPLRCDNKGNVIIFDGKQWLSYEHFEKKYPKLSIVKNNWSNSDKTKNYLKDIKSYK